MNYCFVILMLCLGCGCVTVKEAKPGLADYAESLAIGTATRAEMETVLGPPEKSEEQRGATILTWIERQQEQRSAWSGSRPEEERRILSGTGYGYQHIIVKEITLTAIFDEKGILRKKQVFEP